MELIRHKITRYFLWALAISIFIWASAHSCFQDEEGFPNGVFCFPVSVGVALIVLGWAISGCYGKFAFWFALALVGQAAALQLIEAGPYVRYQHYKPFYRLLMVSHPILLFFLLVQTVLVVAGIKNRWSIIRDWLHQNFKFWQLLCVGLIFFLSSATVSRNISKYLIELFFATFIQTIILGNIILMVWDLPKEMLISWKQRFERWFGCSKKENVYGSKRVDRFVLIAAGWVVVLSSVLCLLSYQHFPHVPDEVMYLYQARYLANGSLTVPAPPVPEAFSFYLIPYESERWYSIFPPGWPLFLALGVLVGTPWLINPMLGGLNILLVYFLIQEMSDRYKARVAVFLLCLSPWYIFMAMNFMSHTFTLTCALIAALCVIQSRKNGKAIWGGLGGMAIGMVSLIRPLDGLIVAGILGLWAIGIGGQRLKISSIITLVVGAVIIGAMILVYNQQITGDPTTFPLTAYYEKYFGHKSNALGFGPERGLGLVHDPFPGHGPTDALVNANFNIFAVNIELLGWGTGSLFLIALLLFSQNKRKGDYFMLIIILVIAATYSLYWFSGGPDFGARYWYLMIIPLIGLTIRGIQMLQENLTVGTSEVRLHSTRVVVACFSLSLIALVNFFPWRAIDKYHHYRGRRPDVASLAEDYGFGRSLVLIRGDDSDYLSAMIYNPIDYFADAPLYAWNRNSKVEARLLEAYSDRPIWIVDGPSITNGPFKVIDGPLSTSQVMEKMSDGD
jgi:hypothetical protein